MDPFVAPFTSQIPFRAIVYPVGYVLHPDEFQAVSGAAAIAGDDRLFAALLEEEGRPHFVLQSSFEDYEALPIAGENALYGPSGTWGLMTSHLDHCVIGGTRPFFDHLSSTFPAIEPGRAPGEPGREPIAFADQVHEFLRDRFRSGKENAVQSWLPELLTHVYGSQEASRLLASHNH
jgi:hypothetical protein